MAALPILSRQSLQSSMAELETIMDHLFRDGYCTKCGRSRVDLVSYGSPDVALEPDDNAGLSCSGRTTAAEIESLRKAWQADREKWDRLF